MARHRLQNELRKDVMEVVNDFETAATTMLRDVGFTFQEQRSH